MASTDASSNLAALYVRAGNELIAVMRPGGTSGMWTTHFVHSDGLGSVRTLTDETGAVVDMRAYEAFGTKNVEAGSETLPYGFAGEPLDSVTHLAYHRERWMDARVGRFEGMDPLLESSDSISCLRCIHGYIYGSDNPTNRIDPTGREDIGSLDAIAIGGFGALGLVAEASLGKGARSALASASLTSLDRLAIDQLNALIPRSISEGREWGGSISWGPPTYKFSILGPVRGGEHMTSIPVDAGLVAIFHTHGDCDPDHQNEVFSNIDRQQATNHAATSYLGTPSYAIRKFSPTTESTSIFYQIFGIGDSGVTTLIPGNGSCQN